MSTPTVVIVGAGGIGQPAAVALAGSGARLVVIDDDRVERSNLHRLPFVSDAAVGELKAHALARALASRAEVQSVIDRVTPATALELLRGASLVVEGSDNYPTKFLVADTCALLGLPSVHGAAVGWLGTVMTVLPGRSACYRCVFEDIPAGDALDCATGGVYGPVTAVVGALMAADARRLLAGDVSQAGALGRYDAFRNAFRSTTMRRRADCALCGDRSTIRDLDPSRYTLPDCAA